MRTSSDSAFIRQVIQRYLCWVQVPNLVLAVVDVGSVGSGVAVQLSGGHSSSGLHISHSSYHCVFAESIALYDVYQAAYSVE